MLTGYSEKTVFTVAGKIAIVNVISRIRSDQKIICNSG